jgi:hypothetical protein
VTACTERHPAAPGGRRRRRGPEGADERTHDWQTFVGDWSREYRRSFARHPKAVPLLTGQPVTDSLTLSGYEQLARVLHDAGFHDEALLHAVAILDSFIIGSALDATAPLGVWADSPDPESALGAAIRAARADPEKRSGRSFELGLHIILAGLGGLRPLP